MKIKIEIELPEEIYKKLKSFCEIKKEQIESKIRSIIEESINSIEIDNF